MKDPLMDLLLSDNLEERVAELRKELQSVDIPVLGVIRPDGTVVWKEDLDSTD